MRLRFFSDKANITRLLLDAGADPNAARRSGIRPIFLVRSVETAKTMVEAGASLEPSEIDNQTPLFQPALHGEWEAVKVFLDEGVDPNIQVTGWDPEFQGWTVLHQVAHADELKWTDVTMLVMTARLLLDYGADPAITDRSGRTAYEIAKTEKLKEVLRPSP